ncbi:vacuolar sorting-associated protein [Xylariaceae sp. FL1272]|nr:vacuolar sorting-associated protein [Xylariaceae sp. FL1272]
MYHLRRLAFVILVFIFIALILTFLPRALAPVPPSREKVEADQRWINTSPHWLDRQACRWFALCGLMHLKADPPTRSNQCGQEARRAATPTAADHIGDGRGQTKRAGALRSIPHYVLAHAPLVHLYSEEYFWPSDIEEHIKHVVPYSDDSPLDQVDALSLSTLDTLNRKTGLLSLKSKDDVECRPKWLHSATNTPVVLSDEPDDYDVDIGTPERRPLQEDTTWFDVDENHPLRRISDPRRKPQSHGHDPLLPKVSRISLPREQRRISARDTNHKPDEEGYSRAPATLIMVDKGSGIMDAFWFFFYAYNLGQTVLGTRYGNHVGDWEHAMVRFESGTPRAVYFSEHEGGQAYTWQAVEKRGNTTHEQRPVIYSAVGSHAMYAMPGTHPYVLPFEMLKDITDQGPLWDPAKNFRGYWYNHTTTAESEALVPTRENPEAPTGWFHYEGSWGDKIYGLDDERQWRLFGQYHYVTGPQGPKFKNLGRRKVCQKLRCRMIHSIAEGKKGSWFS